MEMIYMDLYSVGEFAKLTSVSIRTLHYYDEIGILIPLRKDNGRRYYDRSHLVSMQKIVTLKFLGFSLEQMKELLLQTDWNLKETLQFQKKLLEEKLLGLQKVMKALDHSIHLAESSETIDASIFTSLIRGIQYQDEHKEWLKDIYTEEKIDEIFSIHPQRQLELEKKFAEILSKLKSKHGSNPGAPDVQYLVSQLMDMLQEVVGEDLPDFFQRTEGSKIATEDPAFPLPLDSSEQEWLRNAIKVYLENAGIKEEADE
ncbi:MerR family transcriptional regulator [Rossellomorea vietnamensis]|uniref:MerR family transcriptional regulator n=2 Tax=Rossellomorea vietnamensis TaxID=218284 RepID=A0A5D4K5F7_9BACI|nr:MerR family transcriptional regulator [Rossellomorea vietnamensis]